MINYQKYPSTFHHPSSPGVQSDDKIATQKQLNSFVGEDVVILEKMDGENTTMYGHPDGFHARSIDSAHNWTRDWCKKLHSCIWQDIGDYRFSGENMFAKHSIVYDNLQSYFYLFSIWDKDNNRLAWDDIIEISEVLDLATPPQFYRGIYDEDVIRKIAKNIDTEKCEGFVVTKTKSFHFSEFNQSLIKWVRDGHVQTDEHWLKNAEQNPINKKTIKPSFMRA